MTVVDNSSFKDCFLNKGMNLKQKYGFELIECDIHKDIDLNSQNCHTIVFLTQGSISVTIDKNPMVNITVPYLFILPNSSHAKLQILSKSTLIIMKFKEYVAICRNGDITDFNIFRPKQRPNLHALPLVPSFITFLKTIEDVLSLGSFCSNYHALKMKEFFFLLNSYYTPVEIALIFDPLFGENLGIKSFVYKNYNSVRSVNELVKKSGMSRTLFFEQFKKVFGSSVKQWMLQKKRT